MDVRDVLPHDLRQWHRRHSVGHRGFLRECRQLVCQHLLAEYPPVPTSSAPQPTRCHVARCSSELHRGWLCRQCLCLLRCPHHVHESTPGLAPGRLLSPFVVPSLPPTLVPWRRSTPPWSCCWWGAHSSWAHGARTTATTDSRVRTLHLVYPALAPALWTLFSLCTMGTLAREWCARKGCALRSAGPCPRVCALPAVFSRCM